MIRWPGSMSIFHIFLRSVTSQQDIVSKVQTINLRLYLQANTP